ncbi:MAG: hypothetical protein KAR11_01120 [Phycisphaerae bacterium]|nr:hypothetical protein [Phycisphaerae bacterium]
MNRISLPCFAFWLTVPTGGLVGFFLARQGFGESFGKEFGGKFTCGFDTVAFAVCAAVIVAAFAIYAVSLRRFAAGRVPWLRFLQPRLNIARVFATAVGWGTLVLLGAAVGGGAASWKVITAAAILAAYCGSVELVAAYAQSQTLRKFGAVAWAFSVVAVGGCGALAVISFAAHGIAAISPWVSVWILLWVSFRSIYCSLLLSKRIAAETANQLAVQLQRGVLLLQGAIITGLIANQAGAIGFIVAMVLLSVCNFLDKRRRN